MEVTRAQVANGVAKFIKNEMIPNVDENIMRVILGIAAGVVETNVEFVDKLLDGTMLSALIKTENGYNMELLKRHAIPAIEQYGAITITVPPIKFISPTEKIMQFNGEDVKKIVDYIEGRA